MLSERDFWRDQLRPFDVIRLDQRLGRAMARAMRFERLILGERTTTAQHFGGARTRSEHQGQVGLRETALLHAVADRLQGIRQADGSSPALVVLDQARQHIELLTHRSARFRVDVALDLSQCPVVISLGLDWLNVHDTVVAFILSYLVEIPPSLIVTPSCT